MRFFLRRKKNRTSVRKLKNKCLDCLLHKTCFFRKHFLSYITVCVLVIVVVLILQVKKYGKTKRRFRIGNLNVLEACKQVGTIDRFIYASSAYALSNDGSFYGISKNSSERLTEEYYNKFGLKYTVIRYGSLYGSRASHNNYIYNLLRNAIINGELNYKGDGQDLREYIHAADSAKLSVDILEDKQYENKYIILTGVERLKRIDLLTMINEIMQNQLKIKKISDNNMGHYKITPYSYHPAVAKKLVPNPFIDLGQGLLECIQRINNELYKK